MLKKQLVFYFHVPDDYETNVAIKMHYACLWKYRDIFDIVEFFISCTENSKKYLMSVKYSLLNIFENKDIRFKEVENDSFCEVRAFKENIIDKLDTFENTLVFFGHTKGTTNVTNYPERVPNILKWIYALYFYSLEFMYEVEKKLIGAYYGRFRSIFGSLSTVAKEGQHLYYPGTFYWMNPMAITNDINNGEIVVPKMADRIYAEFFPSVYKHDEYFMGKTDGHNGVMAADGTFDYYQCDFDDVVRYYGDYDLFMKNYNELIKEIQ